MKSTNIMRAFCALAALALSGQYTREVRAQATQVPPAKQCFQATAGISGMVGALGSIAGGSGGVSGVYPGVPLMGGSGTGATANITVSGGSVVSVTILSPGIAYVAGNTLSATSGSIGGVSGFSVPVASTSINSSLAGGTVGMYIPGTLTVAQTWKNSAQTTLNTNPISLDANGCAFIYGSGTYRQILSDSLGNVVWDQVTASPAPNPYWAGTATGTPNAITVSDSAFARIDGQSIQFIAAYSNTGAATLNAGSGAIPIVKNTATGLLPLTGGEIIATNAQFATYSALYSEFILQSSSPSAAASTAAASAVGFRNRIINGDMRIDQRNAGTPQTITAGAAWAYTVDRWQAASVGGNVFGQQIAGGTIAQNQYQFIGGSGVSAIYFSQRIESNNSYDLAGSTAQICANLTNSLLTSVTWSAYSAATTDSFGTFAAPTHAFIATGTWTITNINNRYCSSINIPASATTGIEVIFSVGAQIAGTWVIGNVQVESGTAPTPFEKLLFTVEQQQCQRYHQSLFYTIVGSITFGGEALAWPMTLPVALRAQPPTRTVSSTSLSGSMNAAPAVSNYDIQGITLYQVSFSSLNAIGTATGFITLDAEL